MEISASLNIPTAAGASALPTDLKGACKALEKEFAQIVFSKMRQALSIKTSKGASQYAKETTGSMLDGQWAELATRGEGLGLWREMYRQLAVDEIK